MVFMILCLIVDCQIYQMKVFLIHGRGDEEQKNGFKRNWIVFFVHEECRGIFPMNKVRNLVAPSSDHSAIILQVSVWRETPRGFRFRFENSWLKEDRYSEIVDKCWQRYGEMAIGEKKQMCS